jgi:hypothetical protein
MSFLTRSGNGTEAAGPPPCSVPERLQGQAFLAFFRTATLMHVLCSKDPGGASTSDLFGMDPYSLTL